MTSAASICSPPSRTSLDLQARGLRLAVAIEASGVGGRGSSRKGLSKIAGGRPYESRADSGLVSQTDRCGFHSLVALNPVKSATLSRAYALETPAPSLNTGPRKRRSTAQPLPWQPSLRGRRNRVSNPPPRSSPDVQTQAFGRSQPLRPHQSQRESRTDVSGRGASSGQCGAGGASRSGLEQRDRPAPSSRQDHVVAICRRQTMECARRRLFRCLLFAAPASNHVARCRGRHIGRSGQRHRHPGGATA